MIPLDYLPFFGAMAAVGATLFGLIFLAISIAPESVTKENAPLERQVKATTAYIALLNPFIISLFALIPHQEIGFAVISLSSIGLLYALAMAMSVLQKANQMNGAFRHRLFILASFFLYGYEFYLAVRLLQSPTDSFALYGLADLLIIISAFGVIRAWELMGIRQSRVTDWFASLRKKGNLSNLEPADSTANIDQERAEA